MTTRAEWAKNLANALGNSNPSGSIIRWISAWTVGENTKARYNPLATTHGAPGATNFNSVGVKNFATPQDGINATVQTLAGDYPGYEDIRGGILFNDVDRARKGLMVAPWGTSGTMVDATYMSSRHIEQEALPSFEGSTESIPSQSAPTNGQVIVNPSNNVSLPEGLPSGKEVFYIALGGILIFFGITLAIRSFVPVQQVVKTIAEAA